MVNITETIRINSEHSIEFGAAPWDHSVATIRRRKNRADGSYDPISSSEIPINEGFVDIGRLVCECLRRDLIPETDMAEILRETLAAAVRQGLTITLV
jgi:hypothetical protein